MFLLFKIHIWVSCFSSINIWNGNFDGIYCILYWDPQLLYDFLLCKQSISGLFLDFLFDILFGLQSEIVDYWILYIMVSVLLDFYWKSCLISSNSDIQFSFVQSKERLFSFKLILDIFHFLDAILFFISRFHIIDL